jgi:hypothetical protein
MGAAMAEQRQPQRRRGLAERLSRRAALRHWAAALTTGATLALPSTSLGRAALAAPAPQNAQPSDASLTISSESAQLLVRYETAGGRLLAASLSAYGTTWIPEASAAGALSIEGLRVDDAPSRLIDGSGGLDLVKSTATSLTLRHRDSRLGLQLEYLASPGNAITCRLGLSNDRPRGTLWIDRAATAAFVLAAGDRTEALGADGTEQAWQPVQQSLPASWGSHELRNAEHDVYPLVRLEADSGSGMIVAPSTATAWRVEVGLDGARRLLRAGEFRTDLRLAPGEQAQLPDVVLIFYQHGYEGAVASLHRYLESISTPPVGWSRTPPVLYNTWFGYGIELSDSGHGSTLRTVAEHAAQLGMEVMVVDAGWYSGSRWQTRESRKANAAACSEGGSDDSAAACSADDEYSQGLGTWTEDASKWLAEAGVDGSPRTGLRNFADYVHSLDVRRPDGSTLGKMRFGLWVEPERIDASSAAELATMTVPGTAAFGTPILDFSRPEVVTLVTARIQRIITDYALDYLKVDANQGVGAEPALGRGGHFFSRWSAGYEQLIRNLRAANPGLHLEHCASGLKRFWIGLPRLFHSSWLDDQVAAENVGPLLAATDALMLPRHKTVLVTENLLRFTEDPDTEHDEDTAGQAVARMRELISAYWGRSQRRLATFGFSTRIDDWQPPDPNPEKFIKVDQPWRAASAAIDEWKSTVRRQM